MSRSSANSMYGGAGGKGSRASVSSLQGLRNAMRPDIRPQQSKENGPQAPQPADDKRTMEGLNNRLSGYLGKVRKLEQSNKALEDQIRDILAKRGLTNNHDWEEIEKPLDTLRKQIHDMTMNNARLLVQIDNNRLASEDFKNKTDAEYVARQSVEQDVLDLRKLVDDNQLTRLNLESQVESTREEVAFLKKDHRDDVAALKEKIRDSNVIVEMDSHPSNLADTINKMRMQYENLATKNREEADEWYRSKFDNIRVEVAKNTETLVTSRSELTELRRKRQLLEVDIQAMQSMIRTLEETLQDTEGRYGRELARWNRILQQLQLELSQVRDKVEQQAEDHQQLLKVKLKLEAEIEKYHRLLGQHDPNNVEFSLEQALRSEPKQQESEKKEEKE